MTRPRDRRPPIDSPPGRAARREPGPGPLRALAGPGLACCVALALLGASAGGLAAQQGIGQREALRLAFPEPAEIERRTAFLEESDLRRAEELAAPGVEVDQPVVTYYVGSVGDSAVGVAYFDAHVVRTLREVLMVVVTPAAEIERIEVLDFNEPADYRPPEGWLDEFRGLGLSDRVSTKGEVVNITGATLTSRAVARAARRVLALHRVIDPLGADGGGEPPGGAAGAAAPDVAGGGTGRP